VSVYNWIIEEIWSNCSAPGIRRLRLFKTLDICSYRAVYPALAGLWVGKGIERMSHSLRRDEIRTKRLHGGLKRSIASNPSQPMIQLAKKRNVTKMTLSKAVRNDLGMMSYCRRRRNILTMWHQYLKTFGYR